MLCNTQYLEFNFYITFPLSFIRIKNYLQLFLNRYPKSFGNYIVICSGIACIRDSRNIKKYFTEVSPAIMHFYRDLQ